MYVYGAIALITYHHVNSFGSVEVHSSLGRPFRQVGKIIVNSVKGNIWVNPVNNLNE